jgi:hypothetical protein
MSMKSCARVSVFVAAFAIAAGAATGCTTAPEPKQDGLLAPAEDAGAPDAATTEASPHDGGVPGTPVADAAQDADSGGPKLVTSIGSTGFIQIYDDAILADFYEDDQIVRTSETTACVEHVRSGTKPTSAAGDITLSGEYFGTDGGPPPIVVLSADEYGHYAAFPEQPFFDRASSMALQIEKSATTTFPAIDALSLQSPQPGMVEILSPVVPANGDPVLVASGKPFEVRWPVPLSGAASQRMLVSIYFVAGLSRVGDVHCAFPLATGKGVIPASLLTDLKTRLGGTVDLGGRLRVLVGDQRIVGSDKWSYVIELSSVDTTNIVEMPSVLR